MSVELALLCVGAPMILAALVARGGLRRLLIFGALGALCAWCVAYINAFVVAALMNNGIGSLSGAQSVVQLTPILEEAVKLLPLGIYLAAAQPDRPRILVGALGIALGFALTEVMTRIAQTDEILTHCSAALTHLACACILGYGLGAVRGKPYLMFPGAFALLCAASTFHAIYNLLVIQHGALRVVAFAMPVTVLAAALWASLRARSREA